MLSEELWETGRISVGMMSTTGDIGGRIGAGRRGQTGPGEEMLVIVGQQSCGRGINCEMKCVLAWWEEIDSLVIEGQKQAWSDDVVGESVVGGGVLGQRAGWVVVNS